MRLPDALAATGDRIHWFETIDSTMDEARRLWRPGGHSRHWIVAAEQGAGRGRQARHWHSPVGNLHVTLLLPTRTPLRDQPKLGFVAAVALARAISMVLPAHAAITLKWPNDLLLDGAKISGLLLEGLGQGDAVAIGMGVNIVSHPPDSPYPAAHLRMLEPGLTREDLFPSLASSLADELDTFAEGKGFPLTRQRWLARAGHLGKSIRVRQGEKAVDGIFVDIDADGRLLLQTPAGLLRIDAGDVFPLDK